MNPAVGAALAETPPSGALGPLPGSGSLAGREVVTPNPQNLGADLAGTGNAYTLGTPVDPSLYGPSGIRTFA